MKSLLTIYTLAMLAVIGIGLYHAPWWLLCLASGSTGYLIVLVLYADRRRPALIDRAEGEIEQ